MKMKKRTPSKIDECSELHKTLSLYAEHKRLSFTTDIRHDIRWYLLTWPLEGHQNRIKIYVMPENLEISLSQFSKFQVFQERVRNDNIFCLLELFLPHGSILQIEFGKFPLDITSQELQRILERARKILNTSYL